MEDRKQEVPETREPACMLCRREEADPDLCGDKREKHGLCAHVFCLFFATLLPRQENERLGILGFLPRDIQRVVSRAAQKHCCVCGRSGATIMCCEGNCDRWFHLPCAKEGGCVTQYITPFSSYCPEHRPEQDVRATPEPGTDCPICMEPVEDRKTYTTMVCPACKRTWFHRDCIQGQAMRAGALFFQCPLCRDGEEFSVEMFILGIRIPFRQPTWEDNDAFGDLALTHSRCNAYMCLYPGGREEAEVQGPWQLLLCSSCAAEGTHRRCSGLSNRTSSWECDSCAGLGTAAPDEPELNSPSVTRQSALEPSHGSAESEASSPSSGSLVASAVSLRSPSAETSYSSSIQHAASEHSLESSSLEISSIGNSSTDSETTSGSSYSSSPDPEESSRCSSPGPDRRRNRARLQHQAPNTRVRSRSGRDRSHRTGPRAQRPRCRETERGTSCRHRGPCQQRQAPNAPVRSRSRRDTSRRTAPSAQRPGRRERASGTSPSSRWGCSRSRQQRQAQHPPIPSRSPRARSNRTAPSAGRPRRRDTPSATSPRTNRSHQIRRAPNPPVRSRSRLDRSQRRAPSAERPRDRDTESAATSPRRNRSRQQRPAPNPPVRARSRRDRSQGPASVTSPRRSRSHQQRQAPNPPVRSRSRRDRSQGPAPSAGGPRRRDTASATSPRRSRSRRQRQAPNPHGPSRSRRDRSQGPAPSAGGPRRRDSASQTSPRRNRSRRQRQVPAGTTESSM